MRHGITAVVVALVLGAVIPAVMGEVGEVDAAELVRKVRADEGWVHEAESMYIRSESVERTEDGERPVVVQEMAWDDRRMLSRFFDETMHYEDLKVFDGERVVHRLRHERGEQYVLGDRPYELVGRTLFLRLAWPRTRAQEGFWWVPEDDPYAAGSRTYYGEPEEYRLAGREVFQGVDCYVLERDAFYMRLYIGVEDHRQYGQSSSVFPHDAGPEREQIRLEIAIEIARDFGVEKHDLQTFHEWWNSLEGDEKAKVDREYWTRMRHLAVPYYEIWMSEWREVAPGRFFPMRQGVRQLFMPGGREAPPDFEHQIVELRIDEPLADELFEIEIPEGAQVRDRRFDPLMVVYEQKAERTAEEWEEMLEEARRQQEEEQRR